MPTDADIAAMPDHEAVPLGLPRYMDAWIVVRAEGRIDSPHFRIAYTIEPQQHAHAWPVYQRQGAILQVGERRMRLNAHQLALLEAVDRFQSVGEDVAARLKQWPALRETMHAPSSARIRIQGFIPPVHYLAVLPKHALQRVDGRLQCASDDSRWAMTANHRYYLA